MKPRCSKRNTGAWRSGVFRPSGQGARDRALASIPRVAVRTGVGSRQAVARWRRAAPLTTLAATMHSNATLGASAVANPRTVYKEEHELFRRSVKAFIDHEIAPTTS